MYLNKDSEGSANCLLRLIETLDVFKSPYGDYKGLIPVWLIETLDVFKFFRDK